MTYESLGQLRMASAEAFVRTAILIDNEPDQDTSPQAQQDKPLLAQSVAFGAEVAPAEGAPEEAHGEEDAGQKPVTAERGHRLAVLPVTNAFAARKITCGFYFPANDDDAVVETALAAARHVDATIVDWQLRPRDTEPARQLIAGLVKDDATAGGRLRLIVVYTGERGIDAECAKLLEHLQSEGLTGFELWDDGRALRSRDTLITFANKPQAANPELEMEGPGARPKDWTELPAFVLEQYGHLAQGLLQAFALKSIGAVRDDTHHLLSVFAPELDGAYLAQRAGIGTPADAEEMMTSILASEFVTSITDRKIPEETLGADAAILALRVRDQPGAIKVKDYKPEPIYEAIIKAKQGGGKEIVADKPTLESLCRTGLDEHIVRLSADARKELDQHFFPDADQALKVLSRFARLASYSREADQSRRMGREELVLTGGIIVRSTIGDGDQAVQRYLLCVQPGCDAVRLQGTVQFPFCQMRESASSFDLILRADGAEKRLKVERKPRSLMMVEFAADPAKQVVRSAKHEGKLGFWSADKATFWEFLAELRPLEAQHFIALLINKFNRIALNGSEWLRLHGGGDGD